MPHLPSDFGNGEDGSSLLYQSGIKTMYLPEEEQLVLNQVIDRVLMGKLFKRTP